MKTILAFLLCCTMTCPIYAGNMLNFQAGQKAAYTVHQDANVAMKSENGNVSIHSNSILGFTVEVLKIDSTTHSFPIEVEVNVTQLKIDENIKLPFNEIAVQYNSYRAKDNPVSLQKIVAKLMKKPLQFTINENYKVEETTGRLEAFEDHFDDKTSVIPTGANGFMFRVLLGQIFHLVGQKDSQKAYNVSSYPLARWDEDISTSSFSSDFEIVDKTEYTIGKSTATAIYGSWKGKAQLCCDWEETKSNLTIDGNIAWNKANPLVQARDILFKIDQKDISSDPVSLHAKIHQKWSSKGL